MTNVLLFTLGSQSILERSPETAEAPSKCKGVKYSYCNLLSRGEKHVQMRMQLNKEEERDQTEKEVSEKRALY